MVGLLRWLQYYQSELTPIILILFVIYSKEVLTDF